MPCIPELTTVVRLLYKTCLPVLTSGEERGRCPYRIAAAPRGSAVPPRSRGRWISMDDVRDRAPDQSVTLADDEQLLKEMGYEQQLPRILRFWTNWAVGF